MTEPGVFWHATYSSKNLTNGIIDKLLLCTNLDEVDQYGRTYLTRTIMSRPSDIIAKILIVAPHLINIRDNNDNTALHYAAKYHSVGVTKLLLELDSRLITYKNDEGNLPIHNAVAHNNLDSISLLVKAGSPLNEPNKYGYTPLHIVRGTTDMYPIVESIVRFGVNSFEVTQNDGYTPLMYHFMAFWQTAERRAIILCLLHLGCDPTKYREDCCKWNQTPITWLKPDRACAAAL
jgi:ankyrin repeat protein